tara:strand:- start:5848 stop:5988 length:141 start_codon:yes stop_codon:yes gene_type:complete
MLFIWIIEFFDTDAPDTWDYGLGIFFSLAFVIILVTDIVAFRSDVR